MSEYQYYEFQAIDEPLSAKAIAELRALSTRARITSTSFVNVYNWGNFRGDSYRVLKKHFDAFLYVANWGSHNLLFRVPRRLIDAEVYSQYDAGQSMSVKIGKDHVVLGFYSDEEGGEWEEGEGCLSSLIPVRADLLAGDLRGLYLGWLLGVESEEVDEDAVEPPVPPGLKDLSGSLESLAEFLRIDEDLLAVAAQCSPGRDEQPGPSEDELRSWIGSLEADQKDLYLLRLVREAGPNLRRELLKRFRESRPARDCDSPQRRRVGELLAARDVRAEDRRRRLAEGRAKAEARRLRKEAAARKVYLDGLAGRVDQVRNEVEELIQTRQPKGYDRALGLLVDLRDVANAGGQSEMDELARHILQIRQQHDRKAAFLRRLDKAGL